MKIYVALLLLLTCLVELNFASGFRRSRSPKWGRTNSRRRTSSRQASTDQSSSSSSSPEAPASTPAKPTAADCAQAGFYPTPGSCLHFYRCVDWAGDGSFYSVFHFTCPVGTVFDDKLDVCNYPRAAGRPECSGGGPPQPSEGTDGQPSTEQSTQVESSSQTSGVEASSEAGDEEGKTEPPPSEVTSPQTAPTEATSPQTSPSEVTSSEISPSEATSSEASPSEITTPQTSPSEVTTPQTSPSEVTTPQTSSTDVTSQQAQTEDTTTAITTVPTTQSTSPGVFSLTCYSDNRYRRHPLYCNQYYYCINDGVWSVPIFTCPTGLLFDEENQICVREVEGVSPDCEQVPYSTPRPVPQVTESSAVTEAPSSGDITTGTDESQTSTDGETTTSPSFTEAPIDMTTQKTWELDPDSLYDCPAPGYYPFEGDCIRFYKCVETDLLQLKGLLYRCPEGFGYSEERQRCLKEEDLPPCQRIPQPAHLRVETATQLAIHDLSWFFKN